MTRRDCVTGTGPTARRPCWSWLAASTLATALLWGCGTPEDAAARGEGASALSHNDLSLGDFNKDGAVDPRDSVAYLKSFGIKLNTYGVTDDVFNPGSSLPRRTYDWQVFDISESCLQSQLQVNPEIFPADQLPGIAVMVRNYLKMPPQLLRELGRRGYTISIFEAIGRLAKRWGGSANGFSVQLVFFHVPNGYSGKLRYVVAPGTWSEWEDLTNVTLNVATGAVSFRRPAAAQTYTGTVGEDMNDGLSSGSTLGGTFLQDGDGNVYSWSVNSEYPFGGTTLPDGDGNGGTAECATTSQTIGRTGPLIQLNLSAAIGQNGIHEVGHVLAYMIREQALSFTTADSGVFSATFPGPTSCVADGSCSLVGSGYVTAYAAGGDEDLAETWAYYVSDRATLDARIQQDISANGSQALANKKAFIMDRVDGPDSAPFALADAAFPVYTFATRNVIKYTNPSVGASPLPGGGQSHVALAGFVDNIPHAWLFAVGTDNAVYYQNVTSSNAFSGWQPFGGHATRLPVAATWFAERGEGLVIMVGKDDAVYYRTLSSGGALGPSASIPGQTTGHPVAVATIDGLAYVFATSADNRVMYATVSPALALSPWREVPGGARSRDGVSASRNPAGDAITIAILDDKFQIALSHLNRSGGTVAFDTSWASEVTHATIGTVPAIYGNRLTVKGFGDGGVYTKSLTSSGGYSLIPAL